MLGYEVYYTQASDAAVFPYIVYDLKANSNGQSAIYDFEVNIWGSGSRADLEDLADQIEYEFEEDINLSDNGLLIFRWLSRFNVDDPNKELQRTMIKFEMKYFK